MAIKNFSFKPAWQLFLAVTAVFLMLAQPLGAAESSATQGTQEESVFQAIKRKTKEWLDWDNNADKAKKEVQKQTEKKPEKKTEKQAQKQSEGKKAIDKIKKRMQKVSDNVSKSVDKDKKTLKKKLNKLLDKK